MNKIEKDMANQCAKGIDGIIREVIESKLGEMPPLEELNARLGVSAYAGSPVKFYTLDGIAILEMHPLVTKQVQKGGRTKLICTTPFRIL